MTLLVLRCADLERSRVFYDALGLTLIAEQHGKGPAHFSCTLGELVLELYPAVEKVSSALRIGVRVANVATRVERVRSVGGVVVRDMTETTRSALVRDPDGNDIELIESDSPV